jgi:hypothetical protein
MGVAGEKIGPEDCERPLRTRCLQAVQGRFEVGDLLAFLPDPGRRDALQLDLDLEDVAGQAHAAERGAEQVALPVV